MDEDVAVTRAEDKAATQLKGILAEMMLMMAGSFRPIAGLEIVSAEQMKN